MSKKVENNIYHDERCTLYPYFVNVMRNGKTCYKKTETLEEAREIRDRFITSSSLTPTHHPNVFERNGSYILEYTIQKEYSDFETACNKAEILTRFAEAG